MELGGVKMNVNLDFPAIILLILLLLGLYVVWRTQRDAADPFDYSDMLRDENGKPSSSRLAVFVCLAISSWSLMYETIKEGSVDPTLFIAYVVVWSGAKVAEKVVDVYIRSRGIAPPPSYEPPAEAPRTAATKSRSVQKPADFPSEPPPETHRPYVERDDES